MKKALVLVAFMLTMVSMNAEASTSDLKHECRQIAKAQPVSVQKRIAKRLFSLSLAEKLADQARQAQEYQKLADVCEPLMRVAYAR